MAEEHPKSLREYAMPARSLGSSIIQAIITAANYEIFLSSGKDHFYLSLWDFSYKKMPFSLRNAPATF